MKKYIALCLAVLMALFLFAGCGDKTDTPATDQDVVTDEPTGDADVPAAADGSWAEYQQYLKDNSQGAPDYDEFVAQVDALGSWDEIDLTTSPWDMLFSESGPYLSTYEEYCAGVIREAGVGGADSAASGDKEEGQPSDDKAEGQPSGDKGDGVPASNAELAPISGGNGDTSEAAYKEYLKAFLAAEKEVNTNMTDDSYAEFVACVDAGTYDVFPADMLFNGMLEYGAAMTYDEFVAAGGVY